MQKLIGENLWQNRVERAKQAGYKFSKCQTGRDDYCSTASTKNRHNGRTKKKKTVLMYHRK